MVERKGVKNGIETNKTIKSVRKGYDKPIVAQVLITEGEERTRTLDRHNGWELLDEIKQEVKQQNSNHANKSERIARNREEKKKNHVEVLKAQKQKHIKRTTQRTLEPEDNEEANKKEGETERPDHGWITVGSKRSNYDVIVYKKREDGKDKFVTETMNKKFFEKINGEGKSYTGWDKEGKVDFIVDERRNRRSQLKNLTSGRRYDDL
ncbi:NAD-dependent protein deacetylase [Acrasis kona]|uniref:NAD-dependent protein deacetylase n=1 Tax=Acrasis kona TaxID=1008807 RepID=A0AAW2ZH55_9EUKA